MGSEMCIRDSLAPIPQVQQRLDILESKFSSLERRIVESDTKVTAVATETKADVSRLAREFDGKLGQLNRTIDEKFATAANAAATQTQTLLQAIENLRRSSAPSPVRRRPRKDGEGDISDEGMLAKVEG